MSRIIYADCAATTPLNPVALEAMLPYLQTHYGNASSLYEPARVARRAVEDARVAVAAALGAKPTEIFFTGGGTEADNWAIRSALTRFEKRNPGVVPHLVTSAVEHHAVLHTVEELGKRGAETTVLPVDRDGRVSPEALRDALRDHTAVVSVMAANNEVGTLMPIAAMTPYARERKILFHTDAVQAVGHIPVDVQAWGVDLLSLAAHKFGGPKGVGALYVRAGVNLPPLLWGGAHERGRRPGTENVAGIVGMAAALTEATAHQQETARRLSAWRDKLIAGVLGTIPRARLTGHPAQRLPGSASFVIECIEGESMILRLDALGICVSSGSACTSGDLDPSHVLIAMGLPHGLAHGSLRVTLGDNNTEEDIDDILAALPPIVRELRAMSPLWNEA